MDEVIKLIVALLGGVTLGGAALIYLLLNPEKIEVWASLLWKLLSKFGGIFKFAHKQYVKHDLQGRVNSFTKEVRKEAPFLSDARVAVQWVNSDVTKKGFLEDGKVILRLRRDDPEEMNFVHGAYLFVSASLLYKTKRYISPSQRQAVDLYVTTKLFEKEKPSALGAFLDEYLHPKMEDTKSKVARYFDKFAQIDRGGFFYSVLLQELDYLGDKVFGKRQDDKIIAEVNSLIDFLEPVANRKVGEENDLDFEQEYCRFAIMIVGKSYNVASGGDVYVNFIRKQVMPKKIETLYLLGNYKNKAVIDNVCSAFDAVFEKCGTRHYTIPLKRHDDTVVDQEQYLVVLRLKGVNVFQPSN